MEKIIHVAGDCAQSHNVTMNSFMVVGCKKEIKVDIRNIYVTFSKRVTGLPGKDFV